MKIRPGGAELFRADGHIHRRMDKQRDTETDRQTWLR